MTKICQVCAPSIGSKDISQLLPMMFTPAEADALHQVCCDHSRNPYLIGKMNQAVMKVRAQLLGEGGVLHAWLHDYRLRDTLPSVDVAMVLEGPVVHAFLPLFLHTLRGLNLMDRVQLHFVDRNVPGPVRAYAEHFGIVYDMPDPNVGQDLCKDVCARMDWMVRNCGKQDWIFISHFDMEIHGPWLDYYRTLITPNVGQIGDHANGLVGYNRAAVSGWDLKEVLRPKAIEDLWPESRAQVYLVRDHYGDLKPRHPSDRRCTTLEYHVKGFDVGERFEIYLQGSGWTVLVESDVEQQRFRVHNGSGGGRCGDVVNQMIMSKTMETLENYSLKPIPL